ncbi:MAG: SH3 domain-containing protein, partial [Acidimicrobiales bacterium]
TALPEPTPLPTPTPEPEVLAEVEEKEPVAAMWTVVDSVNSLNMRAEPTTSAEIVATLGPGDSELAGTGETATADGFEWVQIAADEDRPAGWVAGQFLAADESATTG